MKSILVLITASPTASANCHSAIAFCESACKSGYDVSVFFYGEGVHNCNSFISPVNDEKNILSEWQGLSEKYQINLIVCNTAANKRGLIAQEDAVVSGSFNISSPFIAGGLAEFSSLSQKTDRLIQF